MILIIDNYDSFTYNLVQLLGKLTSQVVVARNDKITVEEVEERRPAGVVISPGPGRPENAGICVELIRKLGARTPILGVCLGHQAIGYAFGARIIHAPVLMHGKTSPIYHDGENLFQGLTSPFEATRYHSLVVEKESLPADLEVKASTEDSVIMALRHKIFPLWGIQFHPESILTNAGPAIISNWLRSIKEIA